MITRAEGCYDVRILLRLREPDATIEPNSLPSRLPEGSGAREQPKVAGPHQVMHVRAAHGDVPGPPAHLRADHVGARADEAERRQEQSRRKSSGCLPVSTIHR